MGFLLAHTLFSCRRQSKAAFELYRRQRISANIQQLATAAEVPAGTARQAILESAAEYIANLQLKKLCQVLPLAGLTAAKFVILMVNILIS